MTGLLIAFEGLDQSGKQTQAELVSAHVIGRGRECRMLSGRYRHRIADMSPARCYRGHVTAR